EHAPRDLSVSDDATTSVQAPPMVQQTTTSTLLGLPAIDPVTAPSKLPESRPAPRGPEPDSARRQTKPLNIAAAASAVKSTQPRGVSPIAPTIASPTASRKAVSKPRPPADEDEDGLTEPTPLVDTIDSNPLVIGDEQVDSGVALPPPPKRSDRFDASGEALVPRSQTALAQQPSSVTTMVVPPMPPVPSGKVLEAVKYLVPLARAIWARQKAQKSIRTLLHGDQRQLDTVLRDLGRAAREAELDAPAIAGEMQRVRDEEERRARAEAAMLDADANAEKERERWLADEAERNTEVASREQEIRGAEDELKKRGEERRSHEAVRAKFDSEIRAAEKRAAQADARAVKAESTPPEKGGGPNTAANARAEADAARREATSLIPARDEARSKVEALDGPISSLTRQVVDGRAAIGLKRKELTEALAAHKRTLAAFEADKRRAEGERDGAEREMSQRFVAAGTLLNLNRVEDPRLVTLYQRIDELKSGVNAREAAIAQLESERHGYDRPAVQKGLLVVGVALGALVLITILLIVLFARH
ncbi:MAG TPA: hypothetical protein VII38_17700, partial [Polyangia bacterium]